MKILDRIIRNTVITSTFLVSFIILGLQSFLSLIQQFQFVGKQNYTIWQVFVTVPMQLPSQFYQLFPMAGFLGVLIGLSRLSSTSQLIIMRTSGVSIARIGWSVIKASILMIIVMTFLGEGIGPNLQQKSEKIRQHALQPNLSTQLLQSIWLHDGNNFIHVSLKNKNTLSHVTQYDFSPTRILKKISFAENGKLVNGQWKLNNIKQTLFLNHQITLKTKKHSDLNFDFEPNLHLQMEITTVRQTLKDLYRTILYRKSIGLSINEFVFSFCQRLLQPITTLVMMTLAVPFVFGSFRNTSMSLRIISGVFIGFIFYMLNQLFGPITLVYQFPPLLAAIIPTGVFLLLAMVLVWRTK